MKQFLLILSCFLYLQACETDTPKITTKQLVGNWLFEQGTIDEQTTGIELLNNLVFTFTETEFHSQLLDAMVPGFSKTEPYSLQEEVIVIKEKLHLTIKDLTTEHLQVSFQLQLGEVSKIYDLHFTKVNKSDKKIEGL